MQPADQHDRTEIHICGVCASPLVQATGWEQLPADHWQIEIFCPDCGSAGTGVYTGPEADAFAEELERGTEILLASLDALAEPA